MYDKGERYYEDSPAYDATIEDIDIDAVKAYMKRIGYGKSPMEYLQENKGFLTYKGYVPQVSTACILLFGKNPQIFFLVPVSVLSSTMVRKRKSAGK